MKTRQLQHVNSERAFLVVFDAGDDLLPSLARFVADAKISGARVSAIGGFREATLGYFELDRKEYKPLEISEQVEVVSLLGNIALDVTKAEPEPRLHLHAIVGRSDGSTRAGHVLRAIVRPTLEMFVVDAGRLEKQFDPATGLTLFRF